MIRLFGRRFLDGLLVEEIIALFFVFCSLFLFVSLVGCSDKALQTTAKASRDIAAADLALETTLIQAQAQGTLTADQIRPIVGVTVTVAEAGKQLDAAITGINSLQSADKKKIIAILQPVILAVGNGITQTGLITNPSLKTAIMASLTALQTALATIQGVLA
jgi:hypothetical protein